jgi:hypothetical protein
MRGSFRFLTFLLVFSLSSGFSLSCALACHSPAPLPPCHQAAKELPGPGIGQVAKICPVLASLNEHAAAPIMSPSGSLGFSAPVILKWESGLLSKHPPLVTALAPPPDIPPPPLPLYLKKRVLRL